MKNNNVKVRIAFWNISTAKRLGTYFSMNMIGVQRMLIGFGMNRAEARQEGDRTHFLELHNGSRVGFPQAIAGIRLRTRILQSGLLPS